MTHNEKWLLGHAGWTALVMLATWLACRIARREAVEDAEDRSYELGWDDCERRRQAMAWLEENAGYELQDREPLDLATEAQVTAAGFDVYRQTHTVHPELEPADAALPPGPNLAAAAADDVPRPGPNPAGPGHPCQLEDCPCAMGTCTHEPGRCCLHASHEHGDETLTSMFAGWGTWEEQLAAIVSEGQTPWYAEMSAM